MTGVDVFADLETAPAKVLNGSWAEKYPDILKMLTEKTFEEQMDFMRYSDIVEQLIEEAGKNA